MARNNMVIFKAGINRGGREITNSLVKRNVYPELVINADQKEDRAEKDAYYWQSLGVQAQWYKKECEAVLKDLSDDIVPIYTIDEVGPIADCIEVKPFGLYQIMIEGPGENGVLLGMDGTLVTGDEASCSASVKLLRSLKVSIENKSSERIWGVSQIRAEGLLKLRRFVSNQTVERISLLQEQRDPNDIPGSPLGLTWRNRRIPLQVLERPANENLREVRQRAFALTASVKTYATALISDAGNRTDIFIIENERKRFLRLHVFLSPSINPSTQRKGNSSTSQMNSTATSIRSLPARATD